MAVERIATGGRAFLVFVFYPKRGLSYADAYRFFCDSRGDGRGPEMKDFQNVLCYQRLVVEAGASASSIALTSIALCSSRHTDT